MWSKIKSTSSYFIYYVTFKLNGSRRTRIALNHNTFILKTNAIPFKKPRLVLVNPWVASQNSLFLIDDIDLGSENPLLLSA